MGSVRRSRGERPKRLKWLRLVLLTVWALMMLCVIVGAVNFFRGTPLV